MGVKGNDVILKVIAHILIIVITILTIWYLIDKFNGIYLYGNNNYYKEYDELLAQSIDNDSFNDGSEEAVTKIDHKVKYSMQEIKNETDAIDLIKDESLKQEEKCNGNNKRIEEEIMDITGIYGVNFCELDEETASGLTDTLRLLYQDYPILKDYVTNLTLVNDGGRQSYIAAFSPSFTFATSNSDDRFPFVIKIQVFLNSSYFLDLQYFKKTVMNARDTNYFPKDTDRYSLIAHEFGHVLTYILAIKHYQGLNTLVLEFNAFKNYSTILKEYSSSTFSYLIIKEALDNYKEKEGAISEKDFLKSISGYATSIDDNGEFMYNESVAEAFHDYYLHKDNAAKASLYVMAVLNKYIERN